MRQERKACIAEFAKRLDSVTGLKYAEFYQALVWAKRELAMVEGSESDCILPLRKARIEQCLIKNFGEDKDLQVTVNKWIELKQHFRPLEPKWEDAGPT